MANLLALGIEQEGAHRWRGHIRAGCGPDQRRGDGGDTCLWKHGQKEKLFLCMNLQNYPAFSTGQVFFEEILVSKVFFQRLII